jgi:large subunit ribosomal protein L29
MVTAADIAEFDTEELEGQLNETRRELFNLRFQLATGQLDNFSRIREVRRDVARMITELRIREIAEAEGLSLDELPGHRAAARRRSEDERLGRDRSTASERRAAARAADEAAQEAAAEDEAEEEDLIEDEVDEDVTDEVDDEVDDADRAEAEDDADADAKDEEE